MKQIVKLICASSLILILSNLIFAQQDCSDPYVIPTIPFSATGLSTEGMGSIFNASDLCGSNAMVNEEYIFQFTADEDMQINIALTNTQIINAGYIPYANIGLFLTDKCPNEPAGNCIAYVDNATSNPSLSNINITGGNSYFITISTANTILGGSNNVNFDISITKNMMHDLELKSIILPTSSCNLNQEAISCVIKNNGTVNASNFELNYFINGGAPITENYSGEISPNSEVNFQFSQLADFDQLGEYNVQVTINYGADEYLDNNLLTATTIKLPTYDVFPFTEDFESNSGYWKSGGSSSSWEWAKPADSPNAPTINSATSGNYCWVTNVNGNANMNESSYIESPCYDLSDLFLPTLQLNYWADFSLFDNSANIQASTDGGLTWNIDIAELSSSSAWVNLIKTIPSLQNQANVKFRINFIGGYLVANGLAIDDFTIKESVLNDVGVSNIVSPNTGCGLSDIEIIKIDVTNYSSQTQNNIKVNYSIDGGNTWLANDQVITSLIPGGTTQHAFTTTADMSQVGEYEIIAKTNHEGDENPENDSFTKIVYKQNTILVDNLYSESFEEGNAGWINYGSSSTLELAEPSFYIINSAGDGDYAWVTNANGYNNPNEVSYLESPCFNLSNLQNPKFKALIQFETTPMLSNFFVEYSLDGMYWDTLRAGTVSNGWYGADLLNFGTWGGSSEGWQEVSTEINFLAGQASVKFRFVFENGSFIPDIPIGFPTEDTEGIAIDLIKIEDCEIIPQAMFSYEIDGFTVNFIDESVNAASWSWNFGDNDIWPSSSTEQNPSFTYLQAGQYYVVLTITNMCGSSSYGTWVNIDPSNTTDKLTDNLKIFPNPISDFLNIENIMDKEIKIYDISGKLIFETISNIDKLKINVEKWTNGIYLIKIDKETKVLIKE